MAAAANRSLDRRRRVSGIGRFIQVTGHLTYPTGQIAFWTRLLKEKDLGFYAGVDLNRGNDPSALGRATG